MLHIEEEVSVIHAELVDGDVVVTFSNRRTLLYPAEYLLALETGARDMSTREAAWLHDARGSKTLN